MSKGPKGIYVSFLGGVGEIGKNMTVIECGDDMIIVDCGVSFPDESYPGIDAIIPDITYVKQNIKRLKGIVLTHGHEDHMGAIQYFYNDLKDVPIYGTSLTCGLVGRKLGVTKRNNLKVVSAGDTISLGCFDVEFIKVTHSMAGACALSITTPLGVVFVTGDYKFDKSPIDNKKTDIKRIAKIGEQGVLLMLGESTNVERKGSSTSEKIVFQGLEKIFVENPSKRLIIACFASSNYRIQQVLWLAKKYNKKVMLAGSSMKAVVDVASACGEIEIPKNVIVSSIQGLKPNDTVILATGSQGEPLSALKKMSQGEFPKVNLSEDDLVVLSSTPIPGNEKCVYDVINDLYKMGANVIYDALNDIHVSGHAYEDELKYMLSLVKPEYFMPVHGEYRHQVKHLEIAREEGVKFNNAVIPEIGDCFIVNKKGIVLSKKVPAGELYVDDFVMLHGDEVLKDRRTLSTYGLIMILACVDSEKGSLEGRVDVVTKGIELTNEIQAKVIDAVERAVVEHDFYTSDLDDLADSVKKNVRRIFYKFNKFPVITPIIVEA